jgi:hypothetical protein
MECPRLLAGVNANISADFLLQDHRALWRAMLELHREGIQTSDQILVAERAGVDVTVVGYLRACGAVLVHFQRYVDKVRELARVRRVRRLAEELTDAEPSDHPRIIEQLQEQRAQPASSSFRHFNDIPEIQFLDIPPAEYIVPALGIARNTITLWTGEDGSGKTLLSYAMSLAVAQGRSFFGMPCPQCPVLYLDLENPAHVVQRRVRAMLGDKSISGLRVWGTWSEAQPPQVGDPQLLGMCKETRPLVIVDPFRYFHNCDEDSSTAMAPVMKYLRACAICGGAVVILHHPAKAQNSKGRGSSAIRAGCDLAFLHTLDNKANIITLRLDKNRQGERRTFTINADFEEVRFELTETARPQHRESEIAQLQELIAKRPGISSSQLAIVAGGRKERVLKVLEEGAGTFWGRRPGRRRSNVFFPIDGIGSQFPSREGKLGNTSETAFLAPGTNGNRSEPGNQTESR